MDPRLTNIRLSAQRSLAKVKHYETHYQRIIDLVDAVEHGMMPESDALDEIGQRLDALEGKHS